MRFLVDAQLPPAFAAGLVERGYSQATLDRIMATITIPLIHEYFGVKLLLVWRTIQNNLPPFEQQVVDILKALERKERPQTG